MADITKKVNPGVPTNERHQSFTNADATAGDILMVKDSLGKTASRVSIETTGGSMSVRFNVHQTIYPLRPVGSGFDETIYGSSRNVSDGRDFIDETADAIIITSGSILTLDQDIPVRDIQLTTVSGVFTITCT